MKDTPDELNKCAVQLAYGGEYIEAVACLKKAILMNNTNYLLWYNLGLTYRQQGDLYGAKEALRYAYQLEPDDETVLDALGVVLLDLHEYGEAEEIFDEALSLNPDNYRLWNNIGVLHFTQGEYDAACDAFEQAVTIFPDYYDALFNLRDTYEELGNETGAAICEAHLKILDKRKKHT